MSTEGYCIYCGASMWRDGEGRLHSRNPEPGCRCSLPEAAPQRYTIDKPEGLGTWFLWDGTPESGQIIKTGSLADVITELEKQ